MSVKILLLSVRWQEMALLVLRRVGLCVGQNQMCHLCGWQNFKIFCAVEKKIKHEALGCRVGKKSAVKFICRPIVSIISVSLMVVVSSFTLAYNGPTPGAGADLILF